MGSRRDDVERFRDEGRVYRWERSDPAWAGHRSAVTLRPGEVILEERYHEERFGQTFSCTDDDFLGGCFQESLREALGDAVLAELLDEVNARRSPPAQPLPAADLPELRFRRWQPPVPEEEVPVEEEATVAPEEEPPPPAASPQAALPAPLGPAVRLTLSSLPRIDLGLIFALRVADPTPVRDLVERLGRPPYLIQGLTREEASALAARLGELGATAEVEG